MDNSDTISFHEINLPYGIFNHNGFFQRHSVYKWHIDETNKDQSLIELYKIPKLPKSCLGSLLDGTYDTYLYMYDELDQHIKI